MARFHLVYLIKELLPSIRTAHTIWPSFDPANKKETTFQGRPLPYSALFSIYPRLFLSTSRYAITHDNTQPIANPALSIQMSFTADVRPVKSCIVSSITAADSPSRAIVERCSLTFFPLLTVIRIQTAPSAPNSVMWANLRICPEVSHVGEFFSCSALWVISPPTIAVTRLLMALENRAGRREFPQMKQRTRATKINRAFFRISNAPRYHLVP